jgi:hypothetical protein
VSNFHLKIESSILSLGFISLCVDTDRVFHVLLFFIIGGHFCFCDVEGAMFDFRLIGAIIRI